MTHTEQDNTPKKQLHLLTLNINELKNDNKRIDLFQQLQNKAIDILFLQETHYSRNKYKKGKRLERKILLAIGTKPKSIRSSHTA